MKKFLVVLAILLLAFGLVGCKEEDSKQTASRPSASSAGEDAGDMESGSAESDVDEKSSGDDWADKFTNFVSMKKGLEFSVTYDYTMSGNGNSDKYTMTQYFAKNKYRMDSIVKNDEGRFYMIDNQFTSCSKQGGEWQCITMASGEDQNNDPSEQFSDIEDNPGDYSTAYRGTRSIAGTTAYCYGVTYGTVGIDAEIEICYSKEGIPLYMKTETGGTSMEMKATKFKKGVSASDFAFPAEPMDMNAMMAQYGQYQ